MMSGLHALLVPLSAAAAMAMVAGCVSVDIASDGGTDMVVVENEGCFLFNLIPIMTGDPEYPNNDVCVLFRNTQKLDTNIKLVEAEAERLGAKGVRNVASHWIDDPIIFLLLKRKILQTSAQLVH